MSSLSSFSGHLTLPTFRLPPRLPLIPLTLVFGPLCHQAAFISVDPSSPSIWRHLSVPSVGRAHGAGQSLSLPRAHMSTQEQAGLGVSRLSPSRPLHSAPTAEKQHATAPRSNEPPHPPVKSRRGFPSTATSLRHALIHLQPRSETAPRPEAHRPSRRWLGANGQRCAGILREDRCGCARVEYQIVASSAAPRAQLASVRRLSLLALLSREL